MNKHACIPLKFAQRSMSVNVKTISTSNYTNSRSFIYHIQSFLVPFLRFPIPQMQPCYFASWRYLQHKLSCSGFRCELAARTVSYFTPDVLHPSRRRQTFHSIAPPFKAQIIPWIIYLTLVAKGRQ